jgi:hypothetical protein
MRIGSLLCGVLSVCSLHLGCSGTSTTIELEQGASVQVLGGWDGLEDRGQIQLTRTSGAASRIYLAAVPRVGDALTRTPDAVLGALQTQVRARREARVEFAAATNEHVRLDWIEGTAHRRHYSVFTGDIVVHVSCFHIAESECDAVAESARGPASTRTPEQPPREPPQYLLLPAATAPPARPRAVRAPDSRMRSYAQGLERRATVTQAERISGMELRP